jgi:hypothetical protein
MTTSMVTMTPRRSASHDGRHRQQSWVTANTKRALSLLRARLIDLGMPIKVQPLDERQAGIYFPFMSHVCRVEKPTLLNNRCNHWRKSWNIRDIENWRFAT